MKYFRAVLILCITLLACLCLVGVALIDPHQLPWATIVICPLVFFVVIAVAGSFV
jgi:hypothetical protein